MAKFPDFKQKEPSKTEKVLYELMMRQEMADRSLWTNSAFISALAMIGNVDPEKVAEILVNSNDKIKDYSTKINEAIDKLEKAKKPATPEGAESAPAEVVASNVSEPTSADETV